MTLTTTTHLNLPGTAQAALEFYRGAFGGTVRIVRYGDAGMPADAPGADKVLFGQLVADNGFRIMAYDIPQRTEPFAGSTRRDDGTTITDRPFFVSVRGESFGEVEGYWHRLADGAEIIEPFAASGWSAGSGMLADRFGVTWVLDVQGSEQ